MRCLFLLTDFEGLEPTAWLEDAKAMHMFAWLTSGELMICRPDELDQARSWVAG